MRKIRLTADTLENVAAWLGSGRIDLRSQDPCCLAAQALERAYAQFQIELTGGETPILRRLKEQMGEIPAGSGTPD